MELLENGLDCLLAAVEHLAGSPSSRNLKRAVTELAGGSELILKERLRRLDWRQLFDDVAIANEGDLRRGEFYSATSPEVIARLRKADVNLSRRQRSRLDTLRARRNRIQHYALIETEEAIRATTAVGLSVIVDFVSDDLGTASLTPAERALFDQVQSALPALKGYVEARHRDISGKVTEATKRGALVLTCPSCDQHALVLDGDASCLFCRYAAAGPVAADDYIGSVLGLVEYIEISQGGEWPRDICPSCGSDAFVDTGEDGDHRFACFSCGVAWADGDIESCARCGGPYEVEDELSVCASCFAAMVDRE